MVGLVMAAACASNSPRSGPGDAGDAGEDGAADACVSECCPDGQTLAQRCAKCGPTDACEELESFCAPRCDGPEDCNDDEDCRGGGCVPFGSLCG